MDKTEADVMRKMLGEFFGFMKHKVEKGEPNTGFTFSNPLQMRALVAVGPTTGGEEFLDTLTHEIHHLAVAIAAELGVDLESESPAYIAGDSARALADTICQLGCRRCN